jgi:MerR family transcriptional regulator/heat shock protein HspR
LKEQEKSEEPLYPISVAARILKISVHTLRMYERKGLIVTFKKKTRHRLYSESDIQRLVCIRRAINEYKFSIAGIKAIYSLIPCWKIMECSEKDRSRCEAFLSHNNPCWLCNHTNTKCENLECRNCKVYNNFTECSSIKGVITGLI